MEKKKEKLEKLYKSYGFETNYDQEELGIYLYKKGRYFGVDIIPLADSYEVKEQAEKIKSKYSELGYAASIKEIKSIEEAEIELYKSFFSYEATRHRLIKKYKDFENKQTRNLLGNKYEYISTPYESPSIKYTEEEKLFIDVISDLLKKENPQLIIIEAAAGFGKTCSAYELLNSITNTQNLRTPIFTELSRNRGAKIFRYILLDEIDIEYPILNSDVVIQQIKKGRIPLIIDGFDELLDKVNFEEDIAASFEKIETMLDTIGNLLEGNAKIILTTRKTAIFSGLEFDKWVEKWNNKFETTRFSIKEPKIKDWLGDDKFKFLKDNETPINYIANPVILTFLKNLPIEEFEAQVINPEMLVKNYFDKMLEREKERQNLIITVEKQYEIFKNVAKLLLELDITSESKEFFKEIIKEQNSKLLEYTRTLYSGNDRPTLENLVDTLATHALLDRKGRDENQIGFINDFILGTLVGDVILESPLEKIEKEYSNYMIEIAATAYKVQSKKNKDILWNRIIGVKEKFSSFSLFNFDISLQDKLTRDYSELYVYDNSFYDILFEVYNISSTVFFNCLFKNCRFNTNNLYGVSFVNCVFDTCEVAGTDYLDSSNEVSTIKCSDKNCDILQYDFHYEKEKDELFTDLEKAILKNLIKISQFKSHHIIQLIHCFEKSEKKNVLRALSNLEVRNFVTIQGNHIYIVINKIPAIKKNLEIE